MAKPLSEHLADLSVRAKHAEDSVAAAKKEAHDKVVARKEKARAAAAAAAERVNNDIKSAENTATRNWNAVRAKVAADINSLKAAENYADRLEWEANVAIDYAIASVEQAELAVLDAIVGRTEAREARA